MKKVLCFGDSNTYGFNPQNGSRYNSSTRWTGILKTMTSKNFEIIEAGCNNRTGFVDNPAGLEQTGYKILPKYLSNDLFMIILAVGINDLQKFFSITNNDIANGLKNMITEIRNASSNTRILILSPSVLTKDTLTGHFNYQFDKTSIEKSLSLAKIYAEVASETNCDFIDLNEFVQVSKIDGLHYNPQEHKTIAHLICKFLNKFV